MGSGCFCGNAVDLSFFKIFICFNQKLLGSPWLSVFGTAVLLEGTAGYHSAASTWLSARGRESDNVETIKSGLRDSNSGTSSLPGMV